MDEKTIEELAAADVAAMQPVAAPKDVKEEAIAEKVKAGLTRKQAIEVLQAQASNDAALAKEETKATKGK